MSLNPHIRSVAILVDFEALPEFKDREGYLPLNIGDNPYGYSVEIVYTVAPDDLTGDEIGVIIALTDIGDVTEREFDATLIAENGDWASPLEQVTLLKACIDHFYANNVGKQFGHIVGEPS